MAYCDTVSQWLVFIQFGWRLLSCAFPDFCRTEMCERACAFTTTTTTAAKLQMKWNEIKANVKCPLHHWTANYFLFFSRSTYVMLHTLFCMDPKWKDKNKTNKRQQNETQKRLAMHWNVHGEYAHGKMHGKRQTHRAHRTLIPANQQL